MSEESFVLTDYERGFLEALIDGEGSISLIKHNKKKLRRGFAWHCSVAIGNDNRKLLEKAQRICHGGHLNPEYGTHYTLQLGIKVMKEILPQLDLIVKREQSILILWAIELLHTQGSHHTPNDEFLEQIYLDIIRLNGDRKVKRFAEFENERIAKELMSSTWGR